MFGGFLCQEKMYVQNSLLAANYSFNTISVCLDKEKIQKVINDIPSIQSNILNAITLRSELNAVRIPIIEVREKSTFNFFFCLVDFGWLNKSRPLGMVFVILSCWKDQLKLFRNFKPWSGEEDPKAGNLFSKFLQSI